MLGKLVPGAGGYVLGRITAVQQTDGLISWPENNAPILDNPYRICYNKRSDNNKKVISHQTGKNGLVRRFRVYPYKIPLNRRKRHTAHLHRNWEYNFGKSVRLWNTHLYTYKYTKAVCYRFNKRLQFGYNSK